MRVVPIQYNKLAQQEKVKARKRERNFIIEAEMEHLQRPTNIQACSSEPLDSFVMVLDKLEQRDTIMV